MVFIVFSRHFALFAPVGYYDEEKDAELLVNKLKGESFMEEDNEVVNNKSNPSTFIYAISCGPELHFLSFEEKTAESKLIELNDDLERPDFHLEKVAMNKPHLELIQDYVSTVELLNAQPMTFDQAGNQIQSPIPTPDLCS